MDVLGSYTGRHDDNEPHCRSPGVRNPAGCRPRIWNRENQSQQTVVMFSSKYKTLLNDKRDSLVSMVNPSILWSSLRQLGVIDDELQQRFQNETTSHGMVEALISHLEKNPAWKMHGFFRACYLNNQEHVMTLVGLDPSQYGDDVNPMQRQPCTGKEKSHFYKSTEGGKMKEISHHMLDGILQHCDSYTRNIMKTSLFGFYNAQMIDLTECYIHPNLTYQKNEREPVVFGKMQMFAKFKNESEPHTVHVDGPPGAGKTTFLREYAHSWSSDFIKCHQDGPEVECHGHDWKFLVYVPADSFKGSAKDAIKDNLKCDKHLRDEMMAWIDDQGEGILIVHDAVDELYDERARESLIEYTKFCKEVSKGPKLLISARSGLCHIVPLHFDRHLSLEGFTVSQAIHYIQKYFAEMHGISDHPIIEYVKEHTEQLDFVLCNPLRSLIFSELSAKGALTLERVKTLNLIKLMKCLEGHIIRREQENQELILSEDDRNDFYRLCVEALFNNERNFPESIIDEHLLFQGFMVKKTERNDEGLDTTYFVFQHEVLFDYMAMRGLVNTLDGDGKYAILLFLCSKESLRNILQLACGYICQYRPEMFDDLIFLLRACLILQCDRKPKWLFRQLNGLICHVEGKHCDKTAKHLGKKLLDLSDKIQGMSSSSILHGSLTTSDCYKINEIRRMINSSFDEDAWKLRDIYWFEGLQHNSNGCLAFITKCLQQGNVVQQQLLCDKTTNQLLPCDWVKLIDSSSGWRCSMFPVSNTRWIEQRWYVAKHSPMDCVYPGKPRDPYLKTTSGICRHQLSIELTAWCPADVTEYVRRSHNLVGISHVWFHFIFNELWGRCPNSHMSRSAWDELFHKSILDPYQLTIYTDTDQPLPCLLPSLLNAVNNLKHLKWITVWGGRIKLQDLQVWVSQCPKKGLYLNLCFMTIVVPSEIDAGVIKVSRTLGIIEPTYTTEEGTKKMHKKSEYYRGEFRERFAGHSDHEVW